MPIEVIEFNGRYYPAFQGSGFAARFIFPVANEICMGIGYDIGCNRKEWSLPGSIPIDPAISGCEYDALNLPPMAVDFIFSSHMLEHVDGWVSVLDYWHKVVRMGGIVCLYLPHPDQEYWLPFNNHKHVSSLSPELIEKYFMSRKMWKNVFVSKGYDANHSFSAMAEKK